jgi:sugar phosphate permease
MFSHPTTPKGSRIFYGWYIVGAMFFMGLIGVAPRQALGLFFDTWSEEFGVTVSQLSAVAAAGWLINGVSQPIVGALTDRFGGRIVMFVSMIAVGIGTFLIGVTVNIWTLAFVYIPIVSFAMSGILFVPGTALLVRWFKRKRGTAISVYSSGTSIGGMLLIPFMAYLLVLVDWRATWMVVGAAMLLLAAPLIWMVLRNDPRDMGLMPDGDPMSEETAAGGMKASQRQGPLAVEAWREAYRTPPMWQLTATYVVCGMTTGAIAIHFVPYAVSEGIPVSTAALAFGLLSFINLVGVLTTGFISDHMLRKNMLTLVYGVRGLAFVALVALPSSIGLWAFALIGGVSWLSSVPQTGALTAEIYGIKRAGTLNGMLNLVHQVGGASAVFGAGLVFDLSGSYTPFFIIAAGTLAFASLVSWMVREKACSARFVQANESA